MSTAPILLDAFCGAGGATKGYQRAGFYVVGVDVAPQPNYCGDEFVQADALDVLAGDLSRYAAIHASPPCQTWSSMTACRPGLADEYPALIEPTRALLIASGLPWVIENVVGAPLLSQPSLDGGFGVVLCGAMFGLRLYRHRPFESSFPLTAPDHPPHRVPASSAGHWRQGTIISVSGNCSPVSEARAAMGIDWMTRDELAESIPPAYTEWIGRCLRAAIEVPA